MRNYANGFFFPSCVLILRFSITPCRDRTYVKEQKQTLLKVNRTRVDKKSPQSYNQSTHVTRKVNQVNGILR